LVWSKFSRIEVSVDFADSRSRHVDPVHVSASPKKVHWPAVSFAREKAGEEVRIEKGVDLGTCVLEAMERT